MKPDMPDWCVHKNVVCNDFNYRCSRKMSGGSEVIKSDYMLKRSQMRGKFKTENYKNRWFQLTSTVLRYCDGSIEVNSSHFNINCIVLFSGYYYICYYCNYYCWY